MRDELVVTAIALLDGGNVTVQGIFMRLLSVSADAFIGNIIAHMVEVATTVEALPSTSEAASSGDVGSSAGAAGGPGGDDAASVGGDSTATSGTTTWGGNTQFEAAVEAAFAAGLQVPKWESATNLFRLVQVLVEGHYLPLQHLLREFTSSRGYEVRNRTAAGRGKAASGRGGGQGVGVVASACEFLDALAPRLCSVGAADLAVQVGGTMVGRVGPVCG